MAHSPLKMTIDEAHEEVKYGWSHCYSSEGLALAVESLDDQPLGYRVNIFLARLCFRGIYFPMLGKFAWLKVIAHNRKTIFMMVKEAIFGRKKRPGSAALEPAYAERETAGSFGGLGLPSQESVNPCMLAFCSGEGSFQRSAFA
jgi:hypothetical protein